jgi:hypothetical protein
MEDIYNAVTEIIAIPQVEKLKERLYELDLPSNIDDLGFSLPQDIWYNILLNTDVHQINKSCQTNRSTSLVCRKPQFWVAYWKLWGIPLSVFDLPQKRSDWFKLHKITTVVNHLTQLFIIEHELRHWVNVFIYFYEYPSVDVTKLLPVVSNTIRQFDEKMDEHSDSEDGEIERKIDIRLFEDDDDIVLQYYYENGNGDTVDEISFDLSMDTMIDFLIRLLYYYPKLEIVDGNGWSYTSYTSIIKSTKGTGLGSNILSRRIKFLKEHNIENDVATL